MIEVRPPEAPIEYSHDEAAAWSIGWSAGFEAAKENVSVPITGVEQWIADWLSLFPAGIMSGGKYIRSDKIACLSKMKTFIKKYKYDKDTIFQATQNYLRDREKENYAFTRAAVYFIDKQGAGSDLATWCDKGRIGVEVKESQSNNENWV